MASSARTNKVNVGIPDWRVFILRPDDKVAGEGILINDRHILTTGNVLREALLGGQPKPQAELKLRLGTNDPITVRAQLSETVTTGSIWIISLPSATGHEPVRAATARTGDRVLEATTPGAWQEAVVGIERADGTVELSTDEERSAPNGLGAVINEAGQLVGVAEDLFGKRMKPAADLPGLAYPSGPAPALREPGSSATADTDGAPGDDRPSPGPVPDTQERPWHPEPRLTRDYPTTEDALAYRRYVEAIAAFLRHRDTRPPLTIGVTGAWGAGKTSLMRMVQEELDPGAGRGEPCGMRFDADSRRRLRRRSGGRDAVTNREVVRTADRPVRPEPLRAELAGDAPIEDGDWRPTVWFNPWMYQNGDQVWAGLAHAIIGQVADRLPTGDRERFWLRLNLKRTDREWVRRGFYRMLFGRLVPLLVFWFVVLVLAGSALLAAGVWPYAATAGKYAGIGGTLVTLVGGIGRSVRSARDSAAAGPFLGLLKQPPVLPKLDTVAPDPGYGGRLGFLHLVQSDMRHVLDLVATDERPLVVFVDDLDRCSPGTVAQVIEAVNLFLAGEFPNCVFVLAMEPAAVAAHVESAYQDLAAAFAADPQGDGSGLGWRFLDKMIQLPLRLPDPDTSTYLDRLLGNEPVPAAPPEEETRYEWVTRKTLQPLVLVDSGTPPLVEAEERVLRPVPGTGPEAARQRRTELVERLATDIRRRLESAGGVREAAIAAQQAVLERGEPLAPETLEAAERVYAELYSDQGAQEPIRSALPALGKANPRELKRYVNLFRFYTFVAERERLRGVAAPDGEAVAKLAAFVVRWPHLLPAGRTGWAARLARLESVARESPDEWPDALAASYPELSAAAGRALREFFGSGPAIGTDAFRLL